MSENIPKTCILCKHMRFDAGSPGYSQYTPGTNWSSECAKGHWEMYGCDASQDEYCRNLLTAETCPDFEMADIESLRK